MEYVILDIIQESPRVKRFVLESKSSVFTNFIPGQFIVLQAVFPDHGVVQRSYSIASKKANEPHLELCIVLNEHGVFTPWLFSLQKGDLIVGSDAQGSFIYLQESKQFKNVFICTGTGVAPFRSMIQEALRDSQQEVHLVFGNRYREDILYHGEWLELAANHDHFHFHFALSREKSEDCYFGYVHPLYENLVKNDLQAHIYVCGWKEMLTETRRNLKALGFSRKQYHFEQYD